jgi:hypothetical protein
MSGLSAAPFGNPAEAIAAFSRAAFCWPIEVNCALMPRAAPEIGAFAWSYASFVIPANWPRNEAYWPLNPEIA